MLRICNRPNSCRRKPIASRRTESTHHGSRSPALPTLHCTVPRSGGRSPGAQSVLIFEPPTSCTYHTFLYIAYRLVPIIHFYTSHIALYLSHIFITFSYIAYRVASTRPGHGGVESGNSELNAPHIMMCMDVWSFLGSRSLRRRFYHGLRASGVACQTGAEPTHPEGSKYSARKNT